MSTGAERPIGLVLRLLLGLIGLAALVAAFVVGVAQLESATTRAALVLGCFCVVVALGGVLLVRGAIRGRIRFRRVRWAGARYR